MQKAHKGKKAKTLGQKSAITESVRKKIEKADRGESIVPEDDGLLAGEFDPFRRLDVSQQTRTRRRLIVDNLSPYLHSCRSLFKVKMLSRRIQRMGDKNVEFAIVNSIRIE